MRKRQLGHMDMSGVLWIALGIAVVLLLGGVAIGWAGWSLWAGAWGAPNRWLGGFVLAIGACLIAGFIWLAVFVAPMWWP